MIMNANYQGLVPHPIEADAIGDKANSSFFPQPEKSNFCALFFRTPSFDRWQLS